MENIILPCSIINFMGIYSCTWSDLSRSNWLIQWLLMDLFVKGCWIRVLFYNSAIVFPKILSLSIGDPSYLAWQLALNCLLQYLGAIFFVETVCNRWKWNSPQIGSMWHLIYHKTFYQKVTWSYWQEKIYLWKQDRKWSLS